jgi:hypothetical protein
MSAVYFVRQLGKVRGPFAPDHVGRLVAAGLIGPAAEVSTDRAGWCPLAAHPGFGGPPAPEPIPQRQPARVPAVAAPVVDDFELDLAALLPPAAPAEASAGSEWFDTVDLGAMGDV